MLTLLLPLTLLFDYCAPDSVTQYMCEPPEEIVRRRLGQRMERR